MGRHPQPEIRQALLDECTDYALEHGLIFVPAEDLPRTQPGDFDVPSGGLWPGGDYNPHLTVEGYRIMAQRVAEALR